MDNKNSFSEIEDLIKSIKSPEAWLQISYHDIKQKYKRSTLGPFWTTVSQAIIVLFLSFLYSNLLNVPLKEYLPYLAVSFILWNLLSSIISESCDVFSSSSNMLLQLRLPFYFYIFRLVSRNFIIFFHNMIIMVIVLIIFPKIFDFNFFPYLMIGLFFYFISAVSVSMIIGIICTRFRDITQIILSLLQLSFFITPILWKKEMVGDDLQWAITFNPIVHYIDIIRYPYLGLDQNYYSLITVITISLLLFVISFLIFKKFKKKINYWL